MECLTGRNISGEISATGVAICGHTRARKWEDWLVAWYLAFPAFLGEIIGLDLTLEIKTAK